MESKRLHSMARMKKPTTAARESFMSNKVMGAVQQRGRAASRDGFN
jgi:hypothetical protein